MGGPEPFKGGATVILAMILLDFPLESSVRVTAKFGGRYTAVSPTTAPRPTASPTINIPHQTGALVMVTEPTLASHRHPESGVR